MIDVFGFQPAYDHDHVSRMEIFIIFCYISKDIPCGSMA